ncbi:MAG: class I SAM-dependent methyltransferase [Myxococcota bacterium]
MICPCCTALHIIPVLERSAVPVVLNRPWIDATSARAVPHAPLQIVGCGECGHLWNQAFNADKLIYDEGYENRQDRSPHFGAYLEERIAALAPRLRAARTLVEIGCGQGHLSERLSTEFDLDVHGFDPAYRPRPTSGRVHLKPALYGRRTAIPETDVVLCRHVIEHVDNPVGLLQQVRAALGRSPKARVVFECPDATWIVQNQVPWDFFFEHAHYFTRTSLRAAFQRAGFEVAHHEAVFGGQYQWIEARIGPRDARNLEPPMHAEDGLNALRTAIQAQCTRLREHLHTLAKDGPVVLWGAGAKGVTLAQLVDPTGQVLAGLVDVNPDKQGQFASGTGLPILAPTDLAPMRAAHAVVLNPNYLHEIRTFTRECAPDLTVHLAETGRRLQCSPRSPSASPRSSAPPTSNVA